MKENKEDPHISFKDLDLLYHLMPSNILALGLSECSISKCTFRHTTGFCHFGLRGRKKTFIDRRQLFATAEKVWSLSSMRRESIAAARTEKLGTHTHSLTHTHSHRTTAIPSLLAYSGEGNDRMTIKVLSSRPSIYMRRDQLWTKSQKFA